MTINYSTFNIKTGDPRSVDQVVSGELVSFNELYEPKQVYKSWIVNPHPLTGNPSVTLYFTDGTLVTFDDYINNGYTVNVVLESL